METHVLYQQSDECDPDMIEALIKAASNGMSRAVVPDITTHSEIISAAFTFLDRTLRSMRKVQAPDERFTTALEVNKALTEMLIDHGHVPN